ncbi:DUF1659 domain-containing protein [Fervidibacillus halotolerans]|uniref:DUF1659 domain-containing protein n=1 Tax=Fervidibacillus halotolerans TaxID=2980027 RepID=A0A9E8M123_9BACI|nr:DUF1659 domain-containing protein [Fervidibacillus halotolerans]WAA13495.1 DUF1659 domain-containing protein [Fervidibacillus halotolerans]
MAESKILDSNIRLVYEAGTDQEGNMIVKRKTYNNIHTDATADDLYSAAQALASLCSLPLFTIERNDRTEIIE